MSQYKISGVWKDDNGVITHYAFHKKTTGGHDRATKKSKAQAIELLETPGNSAITWVWNYRESIWKTGEAVLVINGRNGKYLRSNPDDTTTDNLGHLIDFDWIAP